VNEIGWFEFGGVRLRAEPARDECFRVVRRDPEMTTHEGTGELARREAVHRHMANEITSLDIAAECLAEFPDTPWGLRLELARQCWDESRHVAGLHRRLVELGGRKGEFPISAFEWNVTCAIDNLAGRLASQNRTFEAGAMDVVGGSIEIWRSAGDDATADVLDAILADEVQHVRFANRWLKAMAQEDRRVLLKIAMAVRFVAQANAVLQAGEGDPRSVDAAAARAVSKAPAVNVGDRRLAEFNDEEIGEILRQAGFRSLVSEGLERSGA
jgi:uncharacterized ferritin-like protein (DUF455 family)